MTEPTSAARTRIGRGILLLALGALLFATVPARAAPDSIWIADILTLDDARPRAEAVAVENGRITAVGAEDEVLALAASGTRIERPAGTLIPGFVDAHGHAWLTGLQALFADLLPPPDGTVSTLEDLQQTLRDWTAKDAFAVEGDWIIGMGYDDAELAGGRHPDRHDLDAVSRDRPVLVVHQSWHLGVANSAALERLGIDAGTPDPDGGHYRRDDRGEPTGVLEETAFMAAMLRILGSLDGEDAVRIVRSGLETYAASGFTTAQDGSTSPEMLASFRAAEQAGQLPIDVIVYPQIASIDPDDPAMAPGPPDTGRLRIGGVKMILDGSPQGRTAWLSRPYHVPPVGRRADYRGYPASDSEQVQQRVDLAFERGWQLLAHANGDAAADQLIAAVRTATERLGPADRRPVMVHAQTVREDQLDAMAELGIVPSFFSAHTFYWGDWHRRMVLGPERADRISPTASAQRRGMRFTVHHDAPVIRPDALRVIQSTVTRRTRSGDILGPEQRVDVMTALKATTIDAAWQAFEEDARGSIEVGKHADFALLSGNPLNTAPDRLVHLEVLGTVKDGDWVFRDGRAGERMAAD